MTEFGKLLVDIRKLRTFVTDYLYTQSLSDENIKIIYQAITKAIIVSSLKLMRVQISAPGATELVSTLETSYGIQLGEQSLYGFDSGTLMSVVEGATGQINDMFEDRLMFFPQEENVVLDKILNNRVFYLGFLSKGLIYAYVWLNKRLAYLVAQGKIDQQAAENYLNNNLAFAAIKRVSDLDIDLPEEDDVKYEVGISPELEAEIALAIGENRKAEVIWAYDEVISKGKTFLAFMKYLIGKYGEKVIYLVNFHTPDFYLEYVEPDKRVDYTSVPSGLSMSIPTDETKFKYVWRVMSPSFGRYQSIGFNDIEV
jgi:hypothetical protein